MKLLACRVSGWIFFLLAVLCCSTGFAQEASQKYFIYIQNETGSPFYVKKDNQVLSSTHAGYIIIPQLKEGKYQLTIGLPGNQVPEASFDVDLSGSGDKGFLLKAADKKLHLYALKDLSAVKPVAVASAAGNRIVDIPEPEPKPKPKAAEKTESLDDLLATQSSENTSSPSADKTSPPPADTSDFAKMLNEITGKNTPAVAQATPAEPQQEEVQKPTPQPEETVVASTPPVDSNTGNQPEQEFDQLAEQVTKSPEEPATKPAPKSEPATSKPDLSFITFPEKENTANQSTPAVSAPAPATDSAAGLEEGRRLEREQRRKERQAKRAAKKAEDDVDFANMQPVDNTPVNTPSTETTENNDATKATAGIPNSDCQKLADEDQFQKVRRKMASRTDDAGIFKVAEKSLKDAECYSAQQIQSLTYLFASDEYKYKFLELAYPHVYDSVHYPALVKTLNSSYYKGRFNALVGK